MEEFNLKRYQIKILKRPVATDNIQDNGHTIGILKRNEK
jgi:hypothetical protein